MLLVVTQQLSDATTRTTLANETCPSLRPGSTVVQCHWRGRVAGGHTPRNAPQFPPAVPCPLSPSSGQWPVQWPSGQWIHVLCTPHKSGRITSTHLPTGHWMCAGSWDASCHSCAVHVGVGFNTSSAIHRPQNRSSLILHVQQQHAGRTRCVGQRLSVAHHPDAVLLARFAILSACASLWSGTAAASPLILCQSIPLWRPACPRRNSLHQRRRIGGRSTSMSSMRDFTC